MTHIANLLMHAVQKHLVFRVCFQQFMVFKKIINYPLTKPDFGGIISPVNEMCF